MTTETRPRLKYRYECWDCGQRFLSKAGATRHVRVKHGREPRYAEAKGQLS